METLHRKYARQRRTEQAYDWVEINSAKECDCCWCVSVCVCVLHVLRTYPIWYAVGPVLASGYHSKSPINFTIIRIRGTVQNYFCTRPESNLFLSHHQHTYFRFLGFVAWIRKKIVFNLLWVYNFKIQSKSVYNFWTIHNQKVDLFDRIEIFCFVWSERDFFEHTVNLAFRSKIDVFDQFYFKFRTMWIFFQCVSNCFCVS